MIHGWVCVSLPAWLAGRGRWTVETAEARGDIGDCVPAAPGQGLVVVQGALDVARRRVWARLALEAPVTEGLGTRIRIQVFEPRCRNEKPPASAERPSKLPLLGSLAQAPERQRGGRLP